NQHNVTELMRTTPGWHQRVFYETFVKSCVQGRDVFESEHYEIFVVQKTGPEKLLCLFSKPSAWLIANQITNGARSKGRTEKRLP
ncbi:hypothetical protein, partial [Escherichia coli]|uniref:hypothetical protein n=1 Tax=Escherichia coli TaxID=562 RepID=UPI0011BA7A2F